MIPEKPAVPFRAAAYIRLSREDGDKAESDSIGNQRKLIDGFLKKSPDLCLADTYIDDGFTGTNFNRPAFRRMLEDIENGRVNCVIVKDLSRFGRDYIDTGKYLERYFPRRHIRFISISDGLDSLNRPYDVLLPIKNVFNEQYARDISRKVHSSMQAKQQAGDFIGAFASYGYRKSPENRNQLLIDEYAAEIVRKIFRLFLQGYGKSRIAALLNQEGVCSPSEYKRLNGERYHNGNCPEGPSFWTYSSVNRILHNEIYTGAMVQGRKIQEMHGKPVTRRPQDWIIVPGTHEAVIDPLTWQKTQKLLNRYSRPSGGRPQTGLFAGLLKCGDCGKALVQKNGLHSSRFYCGSYVRSGRQRCTPHSVSGAFLEQEILKDLNHLISESQNLSLLAADAVSSARCFPGAGNPAGREQERKRLLGELRKIRRRKKEIYEDYREHLLSKEEFSSYHLEYQNREKLMEQELSVFNRPVRENDIQKFSEAPPWLRQLLKDRKLDLLDRITVTEMVDSIQIFENQRIRIRYRFRQ